MRNGQVSALGAFLLSWALACSAPPPSNDPVDLINPERWEVGQLALDPTPEHAPAQVDCGPGTYRVEGSPPFLSFEVNTGVCNYLIASQPLLRQLREGQILEGNVWHLDLDATLPGPSHASVSIDGVVLWEVTVNVPSKAQLYPIAQVAPRDFAPGVPVVFHLHNHGTNEWTIQSIKAR